MLINKTSRPTPKNSGWWNLSWDEAIFKIANIKQLELVALTVKCFFMPSKIALTAKVAKVYVIGKGVHRRCPFSCPRNIGMSTKVWSFSEGRKSIKLRRFLCCVIQRMFFEQERYTVEYFSVKKLKSINLRWLIFVRPKILHFPRIYIRKSAFRDSRIKTLCKDLLLRMGFTGIFSEDWFSWVSCIWIFSEDLFLRIKKIFAWQKLIVLNILYLAIW